MPYISIHITSGSWCSCKFCWFIFIICTYNYLTCCYFILIILRFFNIAFEEMHFWNFFGKTINNLSLIFSSYELFGDIFLCLNNMVLSSLSLSVLSKTHRPPARDFPSALLFHHGHSHCTGPFSSRRFLEKV